jgi:hypothetical protein
MLSHGNITRAWSRVLDHGYVQFRVRMARPGEKMTLAGQPGPLAS